MTIAIIVNIAWTSICLGSNVWNIDRSTDAMLSLCVALGISFHAALLIYALGRVSRLDLYLCVLGAAAANGGAVCEVAASLQWDNSFLWNIVSWRTHAIVSSAGSIALFAGMVLCIILIAKLMWSFPGRSLINSRWLMFVTAWIGASAATMFFGALAAGDTGFYMDSDADFLLWLRYLRHEGILSVPIRASAIAFIVYTSLLVWKAVAIAGESKKAALSNRAVSPKQNDAFR